MANTTMKQGMSCHQDDSAFQQHAVLLADSYARLTGRALIDAQPDDGTLAQSLFEAPFALLSHGTEPDPLFNYANRCALRLFALDWASMQGLPSRHSAETGQREARARLLAQVSRNGYIDDYCGVRISSSGQRFWIEGATVWNLVDAQGHYHGQAACFSQWRAITDEDDISG